MLATGIKVEQIYLWVFHIIWSTILKRKRQKFGNRGEKAVVKKNRGTFVVNKRLVILLMN